MLMIRIRRTCIPKFYIAIFYLSTKYNTTYGYINEQPARNFQFEAHILDKLETENTGTLLNN